MRHVNIVFLVFVISKSEGVDCLLPLREKFAAPKGKYIFHRKAPHQYEGLVLAVRRRRTRQEGAIKSAQRTPCAIIMYCSSSPHRGGDAH